MYAIFIGDICDSIECLGLALPLLTPLQVLTGPTESVALVDKGLTRGSASSLGDQSALVAI